MSKLKYLIFCLVLIFAISSCGKKKVFKRFHLAREEKTFTYEFQPKVWKRTYISPKFEETSKANFALSIINIEKESVLRLDTDIQFAFLVLNGEGLFYGEDKEYFIKKDIAGYGYSCPAYINAKKEIKLILLERKTFLDSEKSLFIKNIFWIGKSEFPEHKNTSAQIIFHPQEDKTNFLLALIQVPKGETNINYDIHPEQHGLFCLEGEIKCNFYQEDKEIFLEKNNSLFVENNLPHIFTGIAEESLLFVYKG